VEVGVDGEAGSVQLIRELRRLEAAEDEVDLVAPGVGDVVGLVADLEGGQQVAARSGDTGQLTQRLRQERRWYMDQRVPGHDARERVVGQPESSERPDEELQLGVLLAGDPDHAG
jgi:hypothetical protein